VKVLLKKVTYLVVYYCAVDISDYIVHSRRTSHHRSQAVRAHHAVYLADECTLVTAAGRRPLRSADSRTCLVKRSLF